MAAGVHERHSSLSRHLHKIGLSATPLISYYKLYRHACMGGGCMRNTIGAKGVAQFLADQPPFASATSSILHPSMGRPPPKRKGKESALEASAGTCSACACVEVLEMPAQAPAVLPLGAAGIMHGGQVQAVGARWRPMELWNAPLGVPRSVMPPCMSSSYVHDW